MVCRTAAIEDEFHFLRHGEGYKEFRLKFIRYLEINDHSTHLEDTDSIRDIFKTANRNSGVHKYRPPPRSIVVIASARGAGGRGSIPERVTPKT